MDAPTVSVIVPNLNGQSLLGECLSAVAGLRYPADKIETVVVDNGSTDGSVYFVNRYFPAVRIISLDTNTGFAGAVNRGAQSAQGEVLFFLNNDAAPRADCLEHLVAPIAEGAASCAGARIESRNGQGTQFAGGGLNFHGVAFEADELSARYGCGDWPPCLFACGGGMAIRREVFVEEGGLDEAFFAYFEDVDLGWRLWISGHRVVCVPDALIYHRKSSTSSRIPVRKLRVLHIRNPLMMVYKNYETTFLRSILPAALTLTLRRLSYTAGIDPAPFRIGAERELALGETSSDPGRLSVDDETGIELSVLGAADLLALEDWVSALPALDARRMEIQSRRQRSDTEITGLFRDPFRCCEDREDYRDLQHLLCCSLGIYDLFSGPAA